MARLPRSFGFSPALLAGPGFGAVATAASAFSDCTDWPRVHQWRSRLSTVGIVAPVEFVAQGPGVTSGGYDDEIVERGRVPSREESWHDFLNMLVWATFPAGKMALHRRQQEAVRRARARCPERPVRDRGGDALAMLDEGGVLAVGDERLLFGHALYEHLVAGRRDAPAFLVPLVAEASSIAAADGALATLLGNPASFASPTEMPRASLSKLTEARLNA